MCLVSHASLKVARTLVMERESLRQEKGAYISIFTLFFIFTKQLDIVSS